ncbi:hypothetical protein [Amycolatopsis sp. H20-H5]|uniref:hypothetical protein n=1 Tax=Amycolatopsis sp. H20-H5 TaxID=3046309 RepID=UPI002DBDC536|nr:hypothetical protein [Amycolatopsis sp. H20-H5]MEC3977433.1 hypothetical protein [Amycolatopsis sp. H20-H5]
MPTSCDVNAWLHARAGTPEADARIQAVAEELSAVSDVDIRWPDVGDKAELHPLELGPELTKRPRRAHRRSAAEFLALQGLSARARQGGRAREFPARLRGRGPGPAGAAPGGRVLHANLVLLTGKDRVRGFFEHKLAFLSVAEAALVVETLLATVTGLLEIVEGGPPVRGVQR